MFPRLNIYKTVLLFGMTVFIILELGIVTNMFSSPPKSGIIHRETDIEAGWTFECLNYTKTRSLHGHMLHYPICLYTSAEDEFISRHIRNGEGWEVEFVQTMLEKLGEPRSDMGFIDLGANIGVFSLAAAAAGHQVVAVEPMESNVIRLRKSIELGNVSDKITVVEAGISNVGGELYLKADRKNKGGSMLVPLELCTSDFNYVCDKRLPIQVLVMDDLLKYIHFKNAIMKIDIEGYEYKAFQAADKLLDAVAVHYIQMEFYKYKILDEPDDLKEINTFITYMKNRGYLPISDSGEFLVNKPWNTWTNDIGWIKG